MDELKLKKFYPEIIASTPLLTTKNLVDKIQSCPTLGDKTSLKIKLQNPSSALKMLSLNHSISKVLLANYTNHINMENTYRDDVDLIRTLNLVDSDPSSRNMTVNLKMFHETKGEKYYICKDFFKELSQTDLKGVTLNDLIQGSGVIRMPSPIQDMDGESYDEFTYWVGPIPDAKDRATLTYDNKHCDLKVDDPDDIFILLSWLDDVLAVNYSARRVSIKNIHLTVQELYKDTDSFVTEGIADMRFSHQKDGYLSNIAAMINCLAYLKTGSPDLRKFKNKPPKLPGRRRLKRLPPNSPLTEDDVILVGYSFKKSPKYSQDFRYQPPHYRRTGKDKIWKWIKGSVHSLKK